MGELIGFFVLFGMALFAGLYYFLQNQRKKVQNKQMLIILKAQRQEHKKCPWCKEPAVTTQVRCANCQLEIGWYETIACKPGEEHLGKAHWEIFERLIRKYSSRNR
jgi:hypothetical protein